MSDWVLRLGTVTGRSLYSRFDSAPFRGNIDAPLTGHHHGDEPSWVRGTNLEPQDRAEAVEALSRVKPRASWSYGPNADLLLVAAPSLITASDVAAAQERLREKWRESDCAVMHFPEDGGLLAIEFRASEKLQPIFDAIVTHCLGTTCTFQIALNQTDAAIRSFRENPKAVAGFLKGEPAFFEVSSAALIALSPNHADVR